MSCVCVFVHLRLGDQGAPGRAVGFHEIGRHGNARDTNIGPVPKTGLFLATTWDFHLYNKATLLLFNTLPRQITSPTVSFDSRHNATIHTTTILGTKHLGNNGSRERVQYYIRARLFHTLITVSEGVQLVYDLSFSHQAGVQFGRSTKTVVGFCVLALGLCSLFPLLRCPPTMRSMRREAIFARFWFWAGIQWMGGHGGVQVELHWTDEIRKGRPGWAFF